MAITPDSNSNYIPPFKNIDPFNFMDLGDDEELLSLPDNTDTFQRTKVDSAEVREIQRHVETQHTGALHTLTQVLKIVPGTICTLAILAGGLTAIVGLLIAFPIVKGVQLTFKFLGLLCGAIYGAATGKGIKKYGLLLAKDYGNQSIPIAIFVATAPVLVFGLGYAIAQLGHSGLKALSLDSLIPKMNTYKIIAQLENPG